VTIYDYVNSDESPYKDIYGQDIYGRYVSEDTPFQAVPAKALANVVGIKTPWIDMIVMLASMIHHKSYAETGYNAEKIGITGMNIEEIKALVE
jgi:opine dehydrogenase